MQRFSKCGLLLGTFLLGACAPGQGLRTEVIFASDRLPEAFERGFAVAPAAHLRSVSDSADVAAEVSNALYLECMTQLRGVDIIAPDLVLQRLGEAGDSGLEGFRQLRRRLVREEAIGSESTRDLGAVIHERYILVAWVDEREVVGLEDLPGDYVDVDFSVDVRRASYAQLEGKLVGCLVDLEAGELLWRARVRYRSERDFSGEKGGTAGDEIARSHGVYDLVALLR